MSSEQTNDVLRQSKIHVNIDVTRNLEQVAIASPRGQRWIGEIAAISNTTFPQTVRIVDFLCLRRSFGKGGVSSMR